MYCGSVISSKKRPRGSPRAYQDGFQPLATLSTRPVKGHCETLDRTASVSCTHRTRRKLAETKMLHLYCLPLPSEYGLYCAVLFADFVRYLSGSGLHIHLFDAIPGHAHITQDKCQYELTL